jgi:serine/threonine protein kinase
MLHQAQAVTEALQEIRNMQKLKNVNVVRLFGITIDPIQVVISDSFISILYLLKVFEICEGGSLHDRLKSLEKPTLLVSQILIYAKQLCDGMEYLESKQCVHRDLAARNVLLSKNEEVF